MVPRFPILFLFLALASPAAGQWNYDGRPLRGGASNSAYRPMGVPDGSGGVVAVWEDWRGSARCYAQRLSGAGWPQWQANGVSVTTTGSYIQGYPWAVSDGAGGAIVAFTQYVASNDIYVQHLNGSGAAQWGTGATVICNAANGQNQPRVVEDGAGGAIVAWLDARSDAVTGDLYAQRVNSSGAVQWTANGVPVCTAPENQSGFELIADGAGGAILAWRDPRSDVSAGDIYAQRLDAAGNALWGTDGVAVCTASLLQQSPGLAADGAGGAYVCWYDARGGGLAVYLQHLNAAGTAQWAADGIQAPSGVSTQLDGAVCPDGAGGVIAAWSEPHSGRYQVYAQRLDAAGTAQWTAGGVPLAPVSFHQRRTRLVTDGAGGAIAVWSDERGGSTTQDLYAQRVAADGSLPWYYPTGVPVVVAAGLQDLGNALADGAGGVGVVWQDQRTSSYDVYVSRLRENGNFAGHSPRITSIADEPGDEGGYVRIGFTGALADSGVALPRAVGYNLWRRTTPAAGTPAVAGGPAGEEALPTAAPDPVALPDLMARAGREPIRLGAALAQAVGFPPGSWVSQGSMAAASQPDYAWTAATGRDSTTAGSADQVFLLSVHTTTPGFWVVGSPDSGHSVDNLPPGAPQNLAGEFSPPGTVQLTWDSNLAGDLWCYRVYRGYSPSFVPGPGNRIGQPTSPSWSDDGFDPATTHYKVSAVDRHSNESAFALLEPWQVLGTPRPRAPEASFLGAVVPHPVVGEAAIHFGLSVPGRATLEIHDLQGRRVRTLADGARPAGWWRERWDLHDDHGRPLPPGVYLLRFEAPGVRTSRRAVVAG